jgi:hypothetical protein
MVEPRILRHEQGPRPRFYPIQSRATFCRYGLGKPWTCVPAPDGTQIELPTWQAATLLLRMRASSFAPTDDGTELLHPHQRLYSYTLISDAAWVNLMWWRAALMRDISRPARFPGSATLVTTWDDGTGNGAGGTLHTTDADQPTYRVGQVAMWMGQ